MNIKQAKQYIEDTVRLYLKRDERGEYRIPVVRQRPIFLLGAPGIGKTAVMEQIARELGLGLVTYSMTHHTRQSALGLPFIVQKNYGGSEVSVTEYTMSEIIASIYDTMEQSGLREGILFLDEINCVSETLAPSMLQFLQYKTFGRHRVPDGWVIVIAGNPPEYNRSVREFDVVTMDRLKVLEVEPDYRAWREYASEQCIHPAIKGFLDLKKDDFYLMEMTGKGRSFVTARGWEDLSVVLRLYEEEKLAVSGELVGQYLRSERVVREFIAYYELFHKYRQDYCVDDILAGKTSDEIIRRARRAPFDERLSLLGMLLDRVLTDMKETMERTDALSAQAAQLKAAGEKADGYAVMKEKYDAELVKAREKSVRTGSALHALFGFAEKAFVGEDGTSGNEMLVLVTELTMNRNAARFLAAFGSEDYRAHSRELMLNERGAELKDEAESILAELEA